MRRFNRTESDRKKSSPAELSETAESRRQIEINHEVEDQVPHITRLRTRSSQRNPPRWWRIYWFRGMWRDIRRRAPFYLSDFVDAWDYRVVPATVYMFFANILPALAFSLDMFDRTHSSYGVNEVLLSTVLAAVVFSLFACQPLTIVGVTGPITVFNYTVYDIMVPTGANYFAFMCVVGLWAMVMHWFLAMSNSCNGLRYVTRFSCDTFGFYVAVIYLQKGVQVLNRQYYVSSTSLYLSVMIALLVLMVAWACGIIGGSTLFHRHVRKFIEDYGTPLTIIFFTGFVHIGHMRNVELQTLPTSRAFYPTADRGWYVNFWDIKKENVGIAFPFALVLTTLFWFDHNVSSLIAQGTEFPLRKPAGFHWDIFLLGLTTGIAGMLGIPFPNGLIPQAPFHTASLCVTRQKRVPNQASNDPSEPERDYHIERITDHVVEQRVSNLVQGCLCVVVMTGPLLVVIGLIPQGVLAGLFFTMGTQALASNGIVLKLFYLLRDRHLAVGDPLRTIKRQHMIWVFVAMELFFFGAAIAVTQTVAAIGFPIVLLAPIPFRAVAMPRVFRREELELLDAPTASPFTMVSVGGNHGESPGAGRGGGGHDSRDGRDGMDGGDGDGTREKQENVTHGTSTGRSPLDTSDEKEEGNSNKTNSPAKQRAGLADTRSGQRSSTIDSEVEPWKL